jgi:TolB-like protein
MSLFEPLQRRKIIPWLGAYLAGGFLALEGVDQLIGNGLLPGVAYRIALACYLFGIPGSMVAAWFHGEKGQQELSKPEIWMQSVLVLGALITSGLIVRDYQAEQAAMIDVAAEMGLDPQGVAILFFEALDDDYEFAADGLTEALIDRLAGVRALNVVSRNGVEPYRGSDVPVDSIARALDVRTLVTGTVDRVGDEFEITARLVDGFSGDPLDRTSFEIDEDALLSAGDSLASIMESFLRTRLGEEIRLRETRGGTSNQEAWSLVRRAEGLIRRADEFEEQDEPEQMLEALAAAESNLSLAEVADPEWVEPLVLRARVAWIAAFAHVALLGDWEASEEVARQGLAHAERAVEAASRDPRALEIRGTIRYFLWLLDVSETAEESDALLASAREDLRGAVDIDPSLASAWSQLSHLYGNIADNTNVILTARRAYEEDAFLREADQILDRLFWAHFDLEQIEEARRRCETGRERFSGNPRFVECRLWLMLSPAATPSPDPAAAVATRDTFVELSPVGERPFAERLGNLLVAGVLRRAGDPDSAEVLFAQGQGDSEIDPGDDLVVEEAKIRSGTGDIDRAMELLKLYVAANPAHTLDVGGQLHWLWRPLRDHPDFQSVRERR